MYVTSSSVPCTTKLQIDNNNNNNLFKFLKRKNAFIMKFIGTDQTSRSCALMGKHEIWGVRFR